MVRTLAKISLVLLIIVALPISFYLVKEYSSMSQNEQMVERVFSTQLNSILFSVNQHSENVLGQWSQMLNQPIDPEGQLMLSLEENLLQNNPAIQSIRFLDLDEHAVIAQVERPGATATFNEWPGPDKIKTLREYLENNYQRLNAASAGTYTQICFLPSVNKGKLACQLIINPDTFIDQNLRAQIQQISQELFYIQIKQKESGRIVFYTGERAEPNDSLQSADMWYVPGYELGIRLKSKTLTDLASERTQRDNYLLLGIGILVILGFLFVIFNIRKEIKLAELKSEFVSNVSHEIRTPLALISMYAETLLLKRVKTEQKQEEYLKTIQQESVRLTGIVNRILNFSRLEKNKQTFRFSEVDLNKLIPEIVESVRAHLEKADVDYQFFPTPGPALVSADRDAVKDILVNLIDNAIKYGSEDHKKITIRTIARKASYLIEVEDNGIGISAKNQKYIFDQFYRVTEGDLAHKAKGSGLGLNLVKRMMNAHGGSVSVRSKLGDGSTFILKFPAKTQTHV